MPEDVKPAAMAQAGSGLLAVLPFLGVLPFVFGAAAVWFSWTLPFGLQPAGFLSSYGLVILGFMAGVHWGQHLSGMRSRLNLPLASNAFALAAWFVWLLLPPRPYFLLLAILFALLLAVDWRLCGSGAISPAYWRTRVQVTIIVIAALAIGALGS